jgi:hypothetical protein
MSRHVTYICGPVDDPDDPLMEFDNYYGRVPKDFNPRTGLSRTHYQAVNTETGRYEWVSRG